MLLKIIQLLGRARSLFERVNLDETYRDDFEQALREGDGRMPNLSRFPGGEYVSSELEAEYQEWKEDQKIRDFAM